MVLLNQRIFWATQEQLNKLYHDQCHLVEQCIWRLVLCTELILDSDLCDYWLISTDLLQLVLERPDLLVVRPQDGGEVARRVGQPVQLDLAPPQLPTQDAVLLRQLLRRVKWKWIDVAAMSQKEAKGRLACSIHFCIEEETRVRFRGVLASGRYKNPYSTIQPHYFIFSHIIVICNYEI